ncbi:MAG: hypothetical protein ACKPFK_09470 [Dolichospermum sp.]
MTLSKFLSILGITSVLVTAQIIGLPNQKPKVAQAQTAGCGSGSSVYLLKIFSPVASNQFKVACDEHDTCYDTSGKSKEECDKAFHKRMLSICARDHNTILGKPLRKACNGRADAYYIGVRDYGGDAYKKAQADARNSKPPSFAIISAGGLCLDAKDYGESRVGNPLQLWNCNGEPAQRWRFTQN